MTDSFNTLQMFCEHVVGKYGGPDGISEEEMAEEFRAVCLKGLPPTLPALRAVSRSCGIKLNALEKMPAKLRGFHEVNGVNRNIYFRNGDTASGIQNTILHEIREMMEKFFARSREGYVPLRTSAKHFAANRFASAVLLPESSFRNKAFETGMDVIALSRFYSKSCAQVLLRMGEVLQGKLFFYAGLYGPGFGEEEDWRVDYWTMGCNDEIPEANFSGFDGFFPRKRKPVVPGSLVDMVLRSRKAHLAPRVTFFDDKTDEGLAAIARPLIDPAVGATKVALVVLLAEDRRLLERQIETAKPVVVEGFHRHL